MNIAVTQHAKQRAGGFEIVSMNSGLLDLKIRGRVAGDAVSTAGDDGV